MGKRVYSVSFENVAVTLVQDLIALYCGSMGCELHGVTLGQKTGTTVQNLVVRVRRLSATVTAGTGGTAPTPQKMSNGDAAATATARVNDMTTKATTSGSPAILHEDVFNTVNGYQFFWPPEDRPSAAPNQALVFELLTAPTASMDMSGTLIFAELF